MADTLPLQMLRRGLVLDLSVAFGESPSHTRSIGFFEAQSALRRAGWMNFDLFNRGERGEDIC